MMALSMTIWNSCRGLFPELIGVWINKNFVGVTGKDLSNFYILLYIKLCFTIYEVLIIKVIPLDKEI